MVYVVESLAQFVTRVEKKNTNKHSDNSAESLSEHSSICEHVQEFVESLSVAELPNGVKDLICNKQFSFA